MCERNIYKLIILECLHEGSQKAIGSIIPYFLRLSNLNGTSVHEEPRRVLVVVGYSL